MRRICAAIVAVVLGVAAGSGSAALAVAPQADAVPTAVVYPSVPPGAVGGNGGNFVLTLAPNGTDFYFLRKNGSAPERLIMRGPDGRESVAGFWPTFGTPACVAGTQNVDTNVSVGAGRRFVLFPAYGCNGGPNFWVLQDNQSKALYNLTGYIPLHLVNTTIPVRFTISANGRTLLGSGMAKSQPKGAAKPAGVVWVNRIDPTTGVVQPPQPFRGCPFTGLHKWRCLGGLWMDTEHAQISADGTKVAIESHRNAGVPLTGPLPFGKLCLNEDIVTVRNLGGPSPSREMLPDPLYDRSTKMCTYLKEPLIALGDRSRGWTLTPDLGRYVTAVDNSLFLDGRNVVSGAFGGVPRAVNSPLAALGSSERFVMSNDGRRFLWVANNGGSSQRLAVGRDQNFQPLARPTAGALTFVSQGLLRRQMALSNDGRRAYFIEDFSGRGVVKSVAVA